MEAEERRKYKVFDSWQFNYMQHLLPFLYMQTCQAPLIYISVWSDSDIFIGFVIDIIFFIGFVALFLHRIKRCASSLRLSSPTTLKYFRLEGTAVTFSGSDAAAPVFLGDEGKAAIEQAQP
ncbi:hypothetical protein MRB53_022006 [Persea americana]|uniref:Uncharacterized protein n=1 Tax=Persea americana TaxID=3435 RepID=A0ACC2L5Q6_PERAE|nr:hypothetical protein MRB53_022006 [Persea americana]